VRPAQRVFNHVSGDIVGQIFLRLGAREAEDARDGDECNHEPVHEQLMIGPLPAEVGVREAADGCPVEGARVSAVHAVEHRSHLGHVGPDARLRETALNDLGAHGAPLPSRSCFLRVRY
jgi:hypothetical protein